MSLWKGQVADSRNIVVQDDDDDDWDTDADFVVSSTKSYQNCNLYRDMGPSIKDVRKNLPFFDPPSPPCSGGVRNH